MPRHSYVVPYRASETDWQQERAAAPPDEILCQLLDKLRQTGSWASASRMTVTSGALQSLCPAVSPGADP
jgi:hypothetical protein